MTDEQIFEVVNSLPIHKGWWSHYARQRVIDMFRKMSAKGLTDDEIIEILSELYDAVADEHGG